jgi:hypothetical protein
MKKFLILIEVYEDVLLSNYDDEACVDIEDLIQAEFGWLEQGGIKLLTIKEQ